MKFNEFLDKVDNPDGLQLVNIKDLDKVANAVETFKTTIADKGIGEVKAIKALDALTKRIENISVKETNQTVKVDLTSLANEIRSLKKSFPKEKNYTPLFNDIVNGIKNIKLGEPIEKAEVFNWLKYRAVDMVEPVTGMQYFGFVSADGEWYILYNESDTGKLRYKFGKDNYQEAWENYANHEYKLPNEAINEIQD